MDEVEDKRRRELRKLGTMREDEIDTSDVPPRKDWSSAVVGKFFRSEKKEVTLEIDADLLAWFDAHRDGSEDPQAAINAAINAAYSAARGTGGKVYLLEGDYSVNGTTTMATGTMLIGSGQGTIIKLANNTNSNLNIIDASFTPYITIADLYID